MPSITIKNIDTRPDLDVYRRDTNGETYTELTIYPDDHIVDVTQEGRSNSQSMAEFHRLVLSSKIDGHPDEDVLREYLESDEGQELIERICAGHDQEWDGHNMVGTLTDDAQEAWDTLIAELNDMPATDWQFWAIDEWDGYWAEENITADTTDKQIVEKAKEFDALALSEHVNLSGSTIEYLTRIRNNKRIDEEE
jgi:hypothetical protein